MHASQKERHKRKSERKKECQWGREGDREDVEALGMLRNYK